MKVLILDDHALIRDALARALADLDPSVTVRPDENVFVEFDQERIHLFDAETTNALKAA